MIDSRPICRNNIQRLVATIVKLRLVMSIKAQRTIKFADAPQSQAVITTCKWTDL